MTPTERPKQGTGGFRDGGIVTVLRPGEGPVPQRGLASPADRLGKICALAGDLLGAGNRGEVRRLHEHLETRSLSAIKAALGDLEDYAAYCRGRGMAGLPASENRLVGFIEDCDRRGLKPATIARRIASLTLVHRALGLAGQGQGDRVRDALRAVRMRGAPVRRAGAIRGGGTDAAPLTGVITLQAMLGACDRDPPGLRDAALLSLGYESGLRMAQLLKIDLARIAEQGDGSAQLLPPVSGEEEAEETIVLSPRTARRLRAWIEAADIRHGPLFRRVAVRRYKARSGTGPVPLRELAWNHRAGEGQLGAKAARPARIEYAIGEHALTPAAVRSIVKRRARQAAERGLVDLRGKALDRAIAALSANSLRRGLAQDVLSAGASRRQD